MIKNNRIKFSLVLGAIVLLLNLSVYSQDQRRPDVGFQAGNTYALSDIETINTKNGNLILTMPLASLPAGRGGSGGYTLNLHYNSKIWNGRQEVFDNTTPPTGNPQFCANFPAQGYRYATEYLEQMDDGGWYIGDYYNLVITDRLSYEGSTPEPDTTNYAKNFYRWKLQVRYPDGSLHEFVPSGGYSSYFNDGYYNVDINGLQSNGSSRSQSDGCAWLTSSSSYQTTPSGMNYYSTDGSFTRLFIPYQPNAYGARPWTLYMPDGTIVEKVPADAPGVGQRISDRNGNKIIFDANGISDDLGRSITTRQVTDPSGQRVTEIVRKGVSGEELVTKIYYKSNYVYRQYLAIDGIETVPPGTERTKEVLGDFYVVDRIVLPAQAGGLEYKFDYYGDAVRPAPGNYTTDGWGELKSIELPGGAKSEYTYQYPSPVYLKASAVLDNGVSQKNLTYTEDYDGTAASKTDSWYYSYGLRGGGFIGPDGSGSAETLLGGASPYGQLSYRTTYSNRRVDRIWQINQPAPNYYASNPSSPINPYVKTEFTTIYDGSGQPSLTAIKDFDFDKNGNVTKVVEYDWVSFSLIPKDTSGDSLGRVTGMPSAASLTVKRITLNSYYYQTPNAATTNVTDGNVYVFGSSPRLKGLLKTTELQNANGTPVSRTEFIYDNNAAAPTIGNLTEMRSWDSTKQATLQNEDGSGFKLVSGNYINSKIAYDQYGNVLTTTDAKGVTNTITYGAVNGFAGLYPTQTEAASNKPEVKRTQAMTYDFYTGLPLTATDVDNNLTSATEYDALGRPTKSKAAVGTSNEIWTQTEYNDIDRRVVSRSDLYAKGDGKKIGVQHYDQLGRVRLTRSIENAATQNTYNEADGIKVQTRYQTGNPYSYSVSSNPYRAATTQAAANEPSMGWTRSKSVNTGKHSEAETFSGAALPAPWGNNTSSSGIVSTDIDAERTLVTDQAGKQRISRTNALGQLTNVWEVKGVDATTEAITFGSLSLNGMKTSYSYDTLNNLTTVNQGVQTRSFSYSSLSRLKTATNPESGTTPTNGTISYQYDDNGNLTSKTDPRNITTSYVYDALNRVTARNYNDNITPNVTYTYDNLLHAKGKLTKVTNSTSTTEYQIFDELGRVTQSQQTTDGAAYGDPMTYSYNLSGALVEQKYPSGRVVKTTLDADGMLAQVQSAKTAAGSLVTYASQFKYTAAGSVSSMRLGNGKWENTVFNSRLQPIQIGLGSSATDQGLLKLNFDYGATNNNGNVQSQTITVPTTGQTPGFTAVQTYNYDELNRLKSATENIGGNSAPSWKQTFDYDRYGNRRFNEANTDTLEANCPTAVCNPQIDPATNKLVGYTFDTAGNTKIDASGKTFTYDAENKQTLVKNANNQTIGEYFYDGDGKRVKKIAGSEVTIFIYDASGKMVAEYSTVTNNNPQISYLTSDHLGSPRINTDASGQVTARHDYQPFGEEIARTSYGADDVRNRFTSYERDEETDLDFAQARMYKYSHGRFTSPDPYNIILESQTEKDENKAREKLNAYLNKPQQWNRYVYVINNPFSYTDPTGEIIELTGNDDDRKRALELLKKAVGADAAKNLHVKYDGGHYYVEYVGDGLAAKGGDFGKVMEELIDSSTVAEFKLSFSDMVTFADGSKERLSDNSGAITRLLGKGHIQIFIKSDAETRANNTSESRDDRGSDGNRLKHNAETIVSHEIGHAWGAVKDNTYERYNNSWFGGSILTENRNRSVQVENMTRQRLRLPLRQRH